jgi:hypothetical protein
MNCDAAVSAAYRRRDVRTETVCYSRLNRDEAPEHAGIPGGRF